MRRAKRIVVKSRAASTLHFGVLVFRNITRLVRERYIYYIYMSQINSYISKRATIKCECRTQHQSFCMRARLVADSRARIIYCVFARPSCEATRVRCGGGAAFGEK